MTDKIVRADSTVVTGIKSCTFKEQVNTAENLRFGACAASSIEFEVYASQANAIPVGEVLTYYQTDANNVDTKIGVFTAQTSIPSRNTYKVIAYDNLTLLETDFSEHLATIQSNFPMALSALLTEVASVSGVTFANSPASAAITIEEFSADGVSCRQVVSWAAEISGQFVRCDEDGNVEFAWYASTPSYSVRPSSGSGGGVTYVAYKQDGLSYKNAACETVDRVAIKPPEEEDVAYIYPSTTGNTYVVSDNLLLTNAESATMNTIAQTLYTAISAISYRPATINIFREGNPYRAGDIVSVTDVQGVTFNTLVMSMTVSLGGVVLESTGRENYDSDSGSGVHQQLVNLANNIVRINKLKVDWADINTAIINYLTANDVTAQNLTIVDASNNTIATFNDTGIVFYDSNGNALANYDASGVTLGDTDGVHAEIDFNSFELYDQSGDVYLSVGDLRNSSGIASVKERFVGDGMTTQFLLTPTARNTSSMTVMVNNVYVTSGVTKATTGVTFDNAPVIGDEIIVSYQTTSPAYHYELGTRTTGTTIGFSSVIVGNLLSAIGICSFAGGGSGNAATGNYSAVVGGTANTAFDSKSAVIGGNYNLAQGVKSAVVGGDDNKAKGTQSVIIGGNGNTTDGNNAAVLGGLYNKASGANQTVSGKYNVEDTTDTYAEIVGNGTADNARSNARTLDWSGNETLAGNLFLNGGSVNVAKGLDRVSKTYSHTFSYAAGTIGTRAIAALIDCSKTGYTIESFSIFGATGTPNFMPILVKQNGTQSVYVLCYRASATAVSDGNVTFQVNYIKT